MKTSTQVLVGLGGLLLASVANAAYTGLYPEVYTNPAFEAPADSITLRLYATFDNSMDQLFGMGGTASEPWYLQSNVEYFQDDVYGGHWAHPAVYDDFVDFLHYDSYWTIGTDDSETGAPLDIVFPGEQPTWSDTEWFADDGGILRSPDDPLTFPVDGKVLIGQFTFLGGYGAYGAVKIHGVSDGEPLNIYETIVFWPTPGTLALFGLAGLGKRRRR